MIQLPTFLVGEVLEAWDEYVAQRARDKTAMTPRSMRGRLKRLEALVDAGHDPLACLDEALNGHWLDFYAPRDKPIERLPGKATNEFLANYEQARKASQTPEAKAAARLALSALRRVS